MMTNVKPYPAYKDSGVEWLGQVPAHWEVRRIKTLFRETDERNGDGRRPLLSLTRARGIVPQAEASNRVASVEDLSNYKVCKSGDLIMNRMQAWSGMFAVSSTDGVISPDYSVFQPKTAIDVNYFEALFKTPVLVGEFAKRSKGIGSGFNRLYTPDFGAVAIVSPPLPEQTAIVRFLDYMDRRMRRYIRTKQKLIKLLEEYKQALIHQAVTGKIDVRTGQPYPAYKPSGVEWLGEVPAHWEVRWLRTVVEIRVSNVDKHSREDEKPVRLCNYVDVYKHDKIRSDMNFMQATASCEEIARFRLQIGDVLITKDSEMWNDIAVPALVETSAPDLISGYHLALLRPKHMVQGGFLFRAIQSPGVSYQFHVEANGVTRFGLSHDAIKSALVPLPSLPEQAAIVEYLDAQTAKIDAAIAAARREIELLREYRERLIADVVTGKVDVREVADRLPEEPAEEEAVEWIEEETTTEEAEDEGLSEESDAEA